MREISAGAVIFHRAGKKIEYLLLQHSPTYWNFPKGRIDNQESVENTARREIKEEADLAEISFIKGFKQTEKYIYTNKQGQRIFKIVIYLLAESKSKKVKLSDEHIGFKWLSYDRAYQQLAFKGTRNLLKKANDFLCGRVPVAKKDD